LISDFVNRYTVYAWRKIAFQGQAVLHDVLQDASEDISTWKWSKVSVNGVNKINMVSRAAS
jgi:hypothetical protein